MHLGAKAFGIMIGGVLGLLLFTAPPSSAEDLHLTVGVKNWYPRWKIKLKGGETLSSNIIAFDCLEEEPHVVPGCLLADASPVMGLRWGRFFAGASLASGSFCFPECDIGKLQGLATIAQREGAVGYYIAPWFGPYIGYFYQKQTYIFSGNPGAVGQQKLGTILTGVVFNIPGAGRTRDIVYGNLALVGLGSGDVLGGIGEIGVTYVAQQLPVSFSAGFKYQELRYQRDILILNGNPRERDTFLGLTLAVHYTLD